MINSLHLSIGNDAQDFINKAKYEKMIILITSGNRTIEKQDEPYAEGCNENGGAFGGGVFIPGKVSI